MLSAIVITTAVLLTGAAIGWVEVRFAKASDLDYKYYEIRR